MFSLTQSIRCRDWFNKVIKAIDGSVNLGSSACRRVISATRKL